MSHDKLIRSLAPSDKEGLGIALNEATVLGAELDLSRRMAGITLSVLTLPPEGPEPADPRLQILLFDVGRAAASLRLGTWNDTAAPVVEFAPSELLQVVRSFGGTAIYGWEFFDIADQDLPNWQNKISFDVSLTSASGHSHSISLFQEDARSRHLDFCIWFDRLLLRNATGDDVSLQEVIDGGKRWWHAFQKNDPRTQNHGMQPLKKT